MAERFNRLFSLPDNLYSQNSPILISAGALLKDTVSGNVIVQLKYKNLSDKTLSALKTQIKYYDVTGQECLGTKDHEYLDLQIQSGQYFGSDKAVVVSNPLARSFSISGLLALFADKETWKWEPEHELSPVPKQQTLEELLGDDELKIQYKLSVNQSAKSAPSEHKGAWLCACGEVNATEVCSACSAQKAVAFRALDLPILIEKKNARLKKAEDDRIERERIAEAQRLEQESKNEADRIARDKEAKRIRRIVSWVAPVVAVITALVLIVTQVIIPSNKYKKAQSMIESKDYESAYTLLSELGGYKDSKTLIIDINYERSLAMMESKDYGNANALLSELGDYKDSKTLIIDNNYERALAMIESKDYENAYAILSELGDYKDSAVKLVETNTALIASSKVGDTVYFGSYEQDNNPANGAESIEWLVLVKEDKRVLVISQLALDAKSYHTQFASVTWETSDLRQWLNDDFFKQAFTPEQQANIRAVTLTNSKNPKYDTPGGKDTTDQVFLLSIEEAEKYFPSIERKAKASVYAESRGAITDNGNVQWWLRSTGRWVDYAAYVNPNGSVYYAGLAVLGNFGVSPAVRPALWIDISNLN